MILINDPLQHETPAKIAEPRALCDRLEALYLQEVDALAERGYFAEHARRNSIRRQVDTFERYRRFIAAEDRVLDWGCRHAPDSCLLRAAFGESIALHGCDFVAPDRFRRFHEFARLDYRMLVDPIRLPYEDQTFDAVVAAGVLEHTMMDLESLKELHRVLKVEGRLIVTFLPNRLSLNEFVARGRGLKAHRRLYGKAEALSMLRHHGFDPLLAAYHQFLPAHRGQKLLGAAWRINRHLERVWPLKLFCSNIMIVSQKVIFM
jgi:SAM-dependent methyltransferase